MGRNIGIKAPDSGNGGQCVDAISEKVGQLRKNMARFENKMESIMEQIRTDMKNCHVEMIEMCKVMLARMDGQS